MVLGPVTLSFVYCRSWGFGLVARKAGDWENYVKDFFLPVDRLHPSNSRWLEMLGLEDSMDASLFYYCSVAGFRGFISHSLLIEKFAMV